MKPRSPRPLQLPAALLACLAACEGADPVPTGSTSSTSSGSGGAAPGCDADVNVAPLDGAGCEALPDDYTPRDRGSANDTWPACISDDNTYHPFDPSITSNTRTAAFEQIAALLRFGEGAAPDPQAFIDARLVYSVDQGLESRIARREDEHYPPAPTACRDLTPEVQLMYPDRCAGPVKIQPIINLAFEQGPLGVDPVLNAARLEAAFLWFFSISLYKEARTCAETQADCDSATGYYAGVQSREGSLGFARYVEARSGQAHDRIWDGLLAVRCWRDLDNPMGAAADLALRDRAVEQLDRATLRGLALIVRQRLGTLDCAQSWETAKILGGVLDREATVRDPAAAGVLRAELARSGAAEVDVAAAQAAIDSLFPCP